MNIIIAGAGKVGFNLAKTLCIGHNVTIIDKNQEALYQIQEHLDILTLKGDVKNVKTYAPLEGQAIDLLIAVTNNDDVNLITSLVADTILEIERKFVRLRHHFFDVEKMKRKLSIDKFIFPIELASKNIASLLEYPKANNVKLFKYTQQKLISIMVSNQLEPRVITSEHYRVVGIERGREFFIPSDDDVEIYPRDLVYLFGYEEEIRTLCKELELETKNNIRNCVVFGGEELGIAISKKLVALGCSVKLIEKDLELCQRADEELQGKAYTIHSKYNSHDIYETENLGDADIFISASHNDEFNIIKCLEARENGISKVIAINNELEYYNLMHSLGIIVVRGPKISAYNTIIEEIGSNKIVIQKSFCGAKAVVYMRNVFSDSKLIGLEVKAPKLKESTLFLIRNHITQPFDKKITLQENDLIIGFSVADQGEKLKQWIYGL